MILGGFEMLFGNKNIWERRSALLESAAGTSHKMFFENKKIAAFFLLLALFLGRGFYAFSEEMEGGNSAEGLSEGLVSSVDSAGGLSTGGQFAEGRVSGQLSGVQALEDHFTGGQLSEGQGYGHLSNGQALEDHFTGGQLSEGQVYGHHSNGQASIIQKKLSNDIPVFLKKVKGSKILSVYFLMDGGVSTFSSELSGLEEAMTNMLCQGSVSYSKEENDAFFFEKLSSFDVMNYQNGCAFSMTSLVKYFDQTFERFTDAFLNPAWDQKEFENMMRTYRQNIFSMMNNPSSLVFYYSRLLNYQDHPYRTSSSVTEESLPNITIAELKKHHNLLLDSRRIKVVVSGDYEEDEILEKIDSKLGWLPAKKGELASHDVPSLKISGGNAVFVHEGASGTGFVLRTFECPGLFDKDFAPCILASDIYDNILFNVVREKRGICYSPQTGVMTSRAGFGYEYLYRVSNFEDLKDALAEARSIMKEGKLIEGKAGDGSYNYIDIREKLEAYKNSFINSRYQSQQTVSGVGNRIASSLLIGGKPDWSDEFASQVLAVSAEEILQVFEKYWLSSPSRFFCVTGRDRQEIAEKVFQ